MTAAAALAAAARGWHVFPAEPGGKRPRPGWRWQDWNTTDPRRIGQWWPGTENTGIACGPSGLVVIDLDTAAGRPVPEPWNRLRGIRGGDDIFTVLLERNGQDWPDTYTVITPSKGWHLYFTAGGHQIRNSAGQIGPWVDVRAHGGYVVAAGSVRPDGAYECTNDRDPASLPGWLASLATAHQEQPTRPAARAHGSGGYVQAAVSREADAVATAPPGQRNDQLNRSAFALGRFIAAGQLDPHTATAVLTGAAARAGLAPAEIRRTILSALKARTR